MPKEVVKSLSLEVLKRHVDVALGTWFRAGLSSAGLRVGPGDLKGTFPLRDPMILWF